MSAAIAFDGVWKKFRRGEHHDSLRDLVPSIAARLLGRRRPQEAADQDFWAVSDVSFDVRPGEALGLIGPNGASKSTILKLLTRILKPTAGRLCGAGAASRAHRSVGRVSSRSTGRRTSSCRVPSRG